MGKLVLRVGRVLGVLLALLSLPSIREDVAGWASWLRWVNTNLYWWPVAIGLVILVASAIPRLVRERAASSRKTTPPEPPTPLAEHHGYQDQPGLSNWTAGHELFEDEEGRHVRLWVRSLDVEEREAFSCSVQDPDGAVFRILQPMPLSGGGGYTDRGGRAEFTYPDSFWEAPLLRTGTYGVKWFSHRSEIKSGTFTVPPRTEPASTGKPAARETPYRSRQAVSHQDSADGHDYERDHPISRVEAVRQGVVNARYEIECTVRQNVAADLVIARVDLPVCITGAECRVRDPTRNEVAWTYPDGYAVKAGESLGYPFGQAVRPLRPGDYQVTWFVHGEQVAEGWFSIPDGEPGWFVRFEAIHVEGQDNVTIYVQGTQGAKLLRELVCEVWVPEVQAPARASGDEQVKSVGPYAGPDGVLDGQATYPKWFDEAPPYLGDGEYRGRWTAWAPHYPVGGQGRRVLVRVLVHLAGPRWRVMSWGRTIV